MYFMIFFGVNADYHSNKKGKAPEFDLKFRGFSFIGK